MSLDSGSQEIIELKNRLQQMYVRAETLILRKQDFSALRDFLPELNAQHEKNSCALARP